jgi:hypothetical protein
MRDTTPEMAAMFRARWLALPAAQRMTFAADMFDTARAFIVASFPDGLSRLETQARLCERLYGPHLAAQYKAAGRRGAVPGMRPDSDKAL